MAKVTVGGASSASRADADFYQTTVSPSGEKIILDAAAPALASIVDEASATVTYVGKAKVGSSAASAVWQIAKITESGTTILTTTWADGNASFDNVWNDRASLSYS